MSKRNSQRNVIPPLGLECLPLSHSQLRDMWNFDNQCGSQIMGAPLRICKFKEDDTRDSTGIPIAELENLKETIKEMWIKAETLFEVFHDPKRPDLGYRLKVKDSLPIKVTLKEEDGFFFGWCSVAPVDSPCSHLYERSPVEPNGYMGGPASLCNWIPDKQATVSLSRPTRNIARYLVRLQCRNLSKGQELLWNYGNNKKMAIESDWFRKGCCDVFKPDKNSSRQEKKKSFTNFIFKETCVLCGKPFSISNKECRIQRKPHFVNSHADFLGSKWNGVGPYMQEEVDAAAVLTEADKLNTLIQTLTKDLKWSVTPACNVISLTEREHYNDPENLKAEFEKRCYLLKAVGTLVLRGAQSSSTILQSEYKLPEILQPIPTSVWRTLNWKGNVQPQFGVYSAPKNEEHASEVQSTILKFCLTL